MQILESVYLAENIKTGISSKQQSDLSQNKTVVKYWILNINQDIIQLITLIWV